MKLVDIEPYKGKVIASHTYCGVNKLIEVDALEEISEQEIVKPVLDKIRAEILVLDDADYDYDGYYKAVTDALKIIDKYRIESEDKG